MRTISSIFQLKIPPIKIIILILQSKILIFRSSFLTMKSSFPIFRTSILIYRNDYLNFAIENFDYKDKLIFLFENNDKG